MFELFRCSGARCIVLCAPRSDDRPDPVASPAPPISDHGHIRSIAGVAKAIQILLIISAAATTLAFPVRLNLRSKLNAHFTQRTAASLQD
ncbi:MAG: hypothetical protein P8N02_04385 [Actinomycetota bacterium]|nr:hypothetical protein [Actinomycetota bacterium]